MENAGIVRFIVKHTRIDLHEPIAALNVMSEIVAAGTLCAAVQGSSEARGALDDLSEAVEVGREAEVEPGRKAARARLMQVVASFRAYEAAVNDLADGDRAIIVLAGLEAHAQALPRPVAVAAE